MEDLGYSDIVLDHYRNPRNAGEIRDTRALAQVGDPESGDVLRLSLRIDGGVIREARFKAFGCTAAIAAGSMATTLLVGLTIAEARRLTDDDVVRALGGLPEEKRRCSVMAEQAIRDALHRYETAAAEVASCRPS